MFNWKERLIFIVLYSMCVVDFYFHRAIFGSSWGEFIHVREVLIFTISFGVLILMRDLIQSLLKAHHGKK